MSGINYVLDTNIVIGLLKGHAEVLELAEHCSEAIFKAQPPNHEFPDILYSLPRFLA